MYEQTMNKKPIQIGDLPAFRLAVLSVVGSLVHNSLDTTISLKEMASIMNENPLITLLRSTLETKSNPPPQLTSSSDPTSDSSSSNSIINTTTASSILHVVDSGPSLSVSVRDVIIALMGLFQGIEIKILENKDQFKLKLSRDEFDEKLRARFSEYEALVKQRVEEDEAEYEDLVKQRQQDKEKIEKEDMMQKGTANGETKQDEDVEMVDGSNVQDAPPVNEGLILLEKLGVAGVFDFSLKGALKSLVKVPLTLEVLKQRVVGEKLTLDELKREVLLMCANCVMCGVPLDVAEVLNVIE